MDEQYETYVDEIIYILQHILPEYEKDNLDQTYCTSIDGIIDILKNIILVYEKGCLNLIEDSVLLKLQYITVKLRSLYH